MHQAVCWGCCKPCSDWQATLGRKWGKTLQGKDCELEKQTQETRDRNQGRSDGRDPRKGTIKTRAGGKLRRKSEGLAGLSCLFSGGGMGAVKERGVHVEGTLS